MKLNYSTLAFSIVAVVLGVGRSHAQEGYAPMGNPYPVGTPAPYAPAGMQPPGMVPPGVMPGYGPGPMMGAGGPAGPMAGPVGPMAGPMPYAQMAAAQVQPTQMQPVAMTTNQYGGEIDGSMYETAGDCVEYENVAGDMNTALPPRAYGSFDAMMIWRKGGNYPPILTTSNATDQGVLGQPSTQVLWGGNQSDGPSLGGRLTVGLWMDDYQNWSVGGRFLGLTNQTLGYTATSAQYPVLAFPFYNTNTSAQDSFLVALPGNGVGAADNTTVNFANTNKLYMGDAFVTKHLYTNNGNRFDFVGGYTFAKIQDSFRMDSTYTVQETGGSIPQGTVVNVVDSFSAMNEFHGGQVGLMAEFQDGPFSWRALGKLSLGNMRQEGTLSGQTTYNGGSAQPVGNYVQATNSGSYGRSQFAYIPEANIEMLYALNCNLDLKLGTTFVYFSDVMTGGTMINNQISPDGSNPNPQFNFVSQEYWILGMTFGVDYHY